MSNAIEIVNYYLNEFLRIVDTGITNPDLILAEKLLEWLRTKSMDEFYMTQLYQFGPRQIRTKDVATRIVDILVDHHRIYKVDGGKFIKIRNRISPVAQLQ
jgi:hypothetical protein